MSGKLSREEFRRQKDLEAARKAGTAAPEIDEDGRVVNPHVPSYMVSSFAAARMRMLTHH